MRLTTELGVLIDNPVPENVEEVLRGLDSAGDAFAILEINDQAWVMAYMLDDYTFDIEYREGSESRHYEAMGTANIYDVVDVFLSYLACDDAWRTRMKWRKWQG